jgi:membrane-anchored mycosin MYCP
MPERDTESGRVERYLADELVVGLAHEQLVLKRLLELGVYPSKREDAEDAKVQSHELGLTKLNFTSDMVKHGMDTLKLSNWTQFGSPYSRALERMADERGGMKNVPAIDQLLLGLRKLFADDNDGWVPDMGKNRAVERVVGKPWVSGGAAGDPQPVDPPRERPVPQDPTRGQGVRIGILDTIIESHPWLAGAFIANPDAVQTPAPSPPAFDLASRARSRPPRDQWSGHATFVSGLILQGAPGAIVELRAVLQKEDLGGDRSATADDTWTGDTWTLATELVKLASSGVDLVNLSLGTFTDDSQAPLVLERAVERLTSHVLLVAAAGNHGKVGQKPAGYGGPWPRPKSALWPAAFTDVIAVGAADAEGGIAEFSPLVPWIDVYTRGVDLESTFLNGPVRRPQDRGTEEFKGFARWSGTSFAAAVVSGAIAARIRPGSRGAREAAEDLLASGRRDPEHRTFIDGPPPFRG